MRTEVRSTGLLHTSQDKDRGGGGRRMGVWGEVSGRLNPLPWRLGCADPGRRRTLPFHGGWGAQIRDGVRFSFHGQPWYNAIHGSPGWTHADPGRTRLGRADPWTADGGAELRTRGVEATEHGARSVDAYSSVLRSSSIVRSLILSNCATENVQKNKFSRWPSENNQAKPRKQHTLRGP
jgi:hypothetical protein